MVSTAMKNKVNEAAKVRTFPPGVPLIIILLGVFLNHVIPITPGFAPGNSWRYWVGGLIVGMSILGLGLWSIFLVRRSGQSENPWKPTTEIIEREPFGISRNPMYLQMVLVCVGFSVMLWNVWILLFTPLCAWVLQYLAIIPEESYLERKFGESYLNYKQRVRRWI